MFPIRLSPQEKATLTGYAKVRAMSLAKFLRVSGEILGSHFIHYERFHYLIRHLLTLSTEIENLHDLGESNSAAMQQVIAEIAEVANQINQDLSGLEALFSLSQYSLHDRQHDHHQ